MSGGCLVEFTLDLENLFEIGFGGWLRVLLRLCLDAIPTGFDGGGEMIVAARLMLLLVFLNPLRAWTDCASSECCSEDVVVATVPMSYDLPSSEHFELRARYINSHAVSTLIVIPGGPGGTAMQLKPDSLPSGFNLLLIDPRTRGCNSQNPSLAIKDLSTRTLALDIVELVKAIGLESVYVYGQSYGTQVATHLVPELEKVGVVVQAAVLDGVVGRLRDASIGYNEALTKLLDRLPQDISAEFASISPTQSLLGKSSRAWADFLLFWLNFGSVSYAGKSTRLLDELLIDGFRTPLGAQGLAAELEKGLHKRLAAKPSDDFYKSIVCRESLQELYDQDLANGKFVRAEGAEDSCQGYSLDRPFEPADYRMRTRLYYLQGADDPSTPSSDALYHFDSQVESDRTFIEFEAAGHAVSATAPKCVQRIWGLIQANLPIEAPSDCETNLTIHRQLKLVP